LRSYIKPIKTLALDAEHRAHKGLNDVIEVLHRPTRKREKIFERFKSHRQAQRMLSEHDQINLIFRPRRYQLTSTSYCHTHNDAFNLLVGYTAQMAA
jgi:putative transposase|tara:strand:- start:1513 stop:1803 length:291 start_codon:yes stop_codon:yes gene_type:complete